jgi:hypothetical protein
MLTYADVCGQVVVGLSHVLLLPFHELPPVLSSRLGTWFQLLVTLLEDVTRAAAGVENARFRRRPSSGVFADSLGAHDEWDDGE